MLVIVFINYGLYFGFRFKHLHVQIEQDLALVVDMELDHVMTKSKFEKLFLSKEYP